MQAAGEGKRRGRDERCQIAGEGGWERGCIQRFLRQRFPKRRSSWPIPVAADDGGFDQPWSEERRRRRASPIAQITRCTSTSRERSMGIG